MRIGRIVFGVESIDVWLCEASFLGSVIHLERALIERAIHCRDDDKATGFQVGAAAFQKARDENMIWVLAIERFARGDIWELKDNGAKSTLPDCL